MLDRRALLKSLAVAFAAANMPLATADQVIADAPLTAAPPQAFSASNWYRFSQTVRGGKVLTANIVEISKHPSLEQNPATVSHGLANNSLDAAVRYLRSQVEKLPDEYTMSFYFKPASDQSCQIHLAQLETRHRALPAT